MPAISRIDWAADWHDVLHRRRARAVELLAEQRFAHDEAGHRRADRAARSTIAWRASRSSAPKGCWSAGCWRPGSACWRSIPTRSPPPAIASAPPPASPIASTRSCSASSAAPITTASPRSRRPAMRRSRCKRWSAHARTSSAVRVHLANQLRAQLDCVLARRPGDLRRHRHARSRSRSSRATRAPERRARTGPQTPARLPGPPRLQRPALRRASCCPAPAQRPARRERRTRGTTHTATPSPGLVAALTPIVTQISLLTSQIAGAVRAHPDGPIFLGLFSDPKSVA